MTYANALRVILGLAIVLMISLGANALQWSAYQTQRDKATAAIEQRDAAAGAAQACSAATDELRTQAERQAAQAQAAIDKARKEARSANARADAERNRRPAVPGDACASAQVETREWLERRKGPQ